MNKLNANENCMLGMGYPFFLNNSRLKDSYYYYEIYSPGLAEDLTPYLSLIKTGEKTISEPKEHGSDILAICIGSKKDIVNTGKQFVENIFMNRDTVVEENGREFPLFEMREGNDLQKALIIGLRDSLRWKLYRFQAGRQLDLLYSPSEYVVFNICGDEDDTQIWFEPVAVYKLGDMEQRNPLKVDLTKLEYPREHFEKKAGKVSEINRMLKALEWKSFKRENLVD